MNKLENKVSIVTGAGVGIGRAIAVLFAEQGSKIVATDIDQQRLDTLDKEIKGNGGEVITLIADMGKEDDIENMIKVAIANYGTLDILVNNAGVMDNFQPVAEVDNSMLERVMKINFDGPFKAMRSAMKIFLAKDSGNIINICSIGGIKGGVAGAAYTASKHALIGLTKNTGYMYSKTGIRCNAIAPGAVNTNIAETIDMSKVTPMVNDRIMSGLALMPRAGGSTEVAKVALFLASDDSSFVNAQTCIVDGGWSSY